VLIANRKCGGSDPAANAICVSSQKHRMDRTILAGGKRKIIDRALCRASQQSEEGEVLCGRGAGGGWCRFALKRGVAGSVSQVQCERFRIRVGSGWSKGSHFSLERGPSFVSSRFAIAASLPCFAVHVISMELDPYWLPDDAFHASGFRGQDPGVLKLDTVTQVNTLLGHG